MPPRTKSSSREKIRQLQRDWLREVVRVTGQKPSQIADELDISSTTLTRFLNQENHKGTLSPPTVALIAEWSGIAPPGTEAAVPQRGMREDGVPWQAAPDDPMAAAIAAMIAGDNNRHAWTMRSDVLALAGVRAGDVMIMQMGATPVAGDIVIAQVERGMGAVTVFRLWQPPNLVGASLDPTAVRPEPVDGERVRIAGVMVAMLRGRS